MESRSASAAPIDRETRMDDLPPAPGVVVRPVELASVSGVAFSCCRPLEFGLRWAWSGNKKNTGFTRRLLTSLSHVKMLKIDYQYVTV